MNVMIHRRLEKLPGGGIIDYPCLECSPIEHMTSTHSLLALFHAPCSLLGVRNLPCKLLQCSEFPRHENAADQPIDDTSSQAQGAEEEQDEGDEVPGRPPYGNQAADRDQQSSEEVRNSCLALEDFARSILLYHLLDGFVMLIIHVPLSTRPRGSWWLCSQCGLDREMVAQGALERGMPHGHAHIDRLYAPLLPSGRKVWIAHEDVIKSFGS